MAQPSRKLRIIAEPKAFYRDRYGSEHCKVNGKRAQRYIRAEDNQFNLEYPTIEIPGGWYDATRPLYIRVASVTVPNQNVSTVCVHPYPIDTVEPSVHKDPANNAVYFSITNDDFMNGRKSFLLKRRKLLQNELKSHGPLRILDSDQRHTVVVTRKSSRSKQLITIYKLWKSQLVFSAFEYIDNHVFHLLPGSSVSSQVMSDEINRQQDESTATSIITTNDRDEKSIICIPERGNWAGGDKVLMLLTKLDRKKPFRMYFDYVELNQKKYIQYELVDTKTIAFQTPACLMTRSEQNLMVPIVAIQAGKVIGKFNFLYLSRNILPTTNVCSCHQLHKSLGVVNSTMSNEQPSSALDVVNSATDNKRPCSVLDVVNSIMSNKRPCSIFDDLFADEEFGSK